MKKIEQTPLTAWQRIMLEEKIAKNYRRRVWELALSVVLFLVCLAGFGAIKEMPNYLLFLEIIGCAVTVMILLCYSGIVIGTIDPWSMREKEKNALSAYVEKADLEIFLKEYF